MTERSLINRITDEASKFDCYETPIDPIEFELTQRRGSAVSMAEIGIKRGDLSMQKTALRLWNQTWPANQTYEHYTSASLLIAVEGSHADESED